VNVVPACDTQEDFVVPMRRRLMRGVDSDPYMPAHQKKSTEACTQARSSVNARL
jgi:hypothetical protein